MTWIKIDDRMPWHPKMARLRDSAIALWVRGLCYASAYLTDGRIPSDAIRLLRDPTKSYEEPPEMELVRLGIWADIEGGWKIVNYLEHQRSREDVEAKRECARNRASKSREARHATVTRNFPVTAAAGVRECHKKAAEPETETETETETEGGRDRPREIPKHLIEATKPILGLMGEDKLRDLLDLYPPHWIRVAASVCIDRGKARADYLRGVLQSYQKNGGPDSEHAGKGCSGQNRKVTGPAAREAGKFDQLEGAGAG